MYLQNQIVLSTSVEMGLLQCPPRSGISNLLRQKCFDYLVDSHSFLARPTLLNRNRSLVTRFSSLRCQDILHIGLATERLVHWDPHLLLLWW